MASREEDAASPSDETDVAPAGSPLAPIDDSTSDPTDSFDVDAWLQYVQLFRSKYNLEESDVITGPPAPPPHSDPFKAEHGWLTHPHGHYGAAADVAQAQRTCIMKAVWELRKLVA